MADFSRLIVEIWEGDGLVKLMGLLGEIFSGQLQPEFPLPEDNLELAHWLEVDLSQDETLRQVRSEMRELAKVSSEAKGKKIKPAATKPYKLEGDNVFFKFKMRASGKNKKTNEMFSQRPSLFDAKKNPIPASQSIWGGSLMKVAYQLIPYHTPMLGAGVSARLKAVQILKLVEGQSQNIFKEEDGFETDTPFD